MNVKKRRKIAVFTPVRDELGILTKSAVEGLRRRASISVTNCKNQLVM